MEPDFRETPLVINVEAGMGETLRRPRAHTGRSHANVRKNISAHPRPCDKGNSTAE